MQDNVRELITKFKKNSKLSMADKEVFERELTKELGSGVYSSDIETILCEGPIDSTMKILAKYLAHIDIEVSRDFLRKFLYSKRIKENKGGTSGMRIVPLFGYYRQEKEAQDEIVEKIFIQSISLAYKNDKSGMNKKVVEEVRKSMVPSILGRDFNLSFINNERTWENTRDLFVEVLLQGEKANYSDLERLYKWLETAGMSMGQYTQDFIFNRIMQNENDIRKENSPVKETSDVVSKSKDLVREKEDNSCPKQENNIDLIKIIESMSSLIVRNGKDIQQLKSDYASLLQRFEKLEFELGKAQINEQQQRETLRELSSEKMSLLKQNDDYKQEISRLENNISALKREIDDQKQFTDTVSRNREKQSEEFINRLASKLKIDYRDYLDAKEMNMTVDLGENMREQLGAVFSILEKNGLNFK